jgi:DNA-binding transcriptional LysR family regulator
MAHSGKSRGPRPGGRRRPAPGDRGVRPRARAATTPPTPPDTAPRTFILGAVPGANPGTWIAKWRERYPHVELVLRSIPADDALRALGDAEVDAALVRLPMDDDALSTIALYEEVTVAVVPSDSHLTAADELEPSDLAGEVLLVPADDVLGASVDGTVAPSFAPPADTAEAIATVAAGIGVVLVPFSLARTHARRDVAHRPVRDVPTSRVALAWPREKTTPDVEAFIGIVRGRTANSSR